MAIIDLVSWSPRDKNMTIFAYRFPETNLSTYTQLIVQESQEAVLFSKGQLLQKFGPGKYTLNTENIPILRRLYGLPFGGKNPFFAEIWFVNKVQPSNIDWQTDSMSIHDVDYNSQIPLVAKGRYGLRVQDAEKFLIKLVGTHDTFTEADLTDQSYGEFLTKTKSTIVRFMSNNRIGMKSVSAHLSDLSEYIKGEVSSYWESIGIALTQFYLTSIEVDTSTETGRRIADAISQQSAQHITGHTWQQEQMFGVANEAVGNMNKGNGGMIGGLLALGMMGGMSGNMGSGMMSPQYNQPTFGPQAPGQPGVVVPGAVDSQPSMAARYVYCSNCSRRFLSTNKFCPNCGDPYNPCPSCGSDNAKTAKRCVNCGATLIQSGESCAACGSPIPPGSTFCPNCGTQVLTANLICSRCGTPLPSNVKFCPHCGQKRQ